MRLSRLLVVAIVGSALGCNSSTSYGGTSSGGNPGPNQVFMQNTAFNPLSRTVSAGTTVTWVNQDGITHTVTYDSGPSTAFNATVGPGGSTSVTFNTAGTVQYHCTIHGSPGAGMHGTIVVQ